MACCSSECERKHLCAHYMGNPRETDGYESLVGWYTHGWVSYSDDECKKHNDCGPHGDWGMFRPINVELLKRQRDALNETIKELESGKYEAKRPY